MRGFISFAISVVNLSRPLIYIIYNKKKKASSSGANLVLNSEMTLSRQLNVCYAVKLSKALHIGSL